MARVQVAESVVVPAGHEAIVTGKVCGDQAPGVGMVYPNLAATDNCQVAVATGLVDAGQGVVPVRVFNPTGDPVTVYKGSRLAMFASVGEDEVIDPEEVLQWVGSEPCLTDSTRSPEGGLVVRGR